MGNAWLKFMAEERASPENKDVPMLKLATHVRPKYDAWKEKNGLSTGGVEEKKAEVEVAVEDKAEVVVEEKMKVYKKKKNKTNKKNKKKKSRGRKSRGRRY